MALPQEQVTALVLAARAAGKARRERDHAAWVAAGRVGDEPSLAPISLLRFAPTHSAADICKALGEAGWEFARVIEEAPRAPRRTFDDAARLVAERGAAAAGVEWPEQRLVQEVRATPQRLVAMMLTGLVADPYLDELGLYLLGSAEQVGRALVELGFALVATRGTAAALEWFGALTGR